MLSDKCPSFLLFATVSESEERQAEDPEGASTWLTCPSAGLFMVLRARWILGGAGETEGDEEAVAEAEEEEEDNDEEEEEEGGATAGTDLLLPGPETLIFARPGDNAEDVEGEEDNEEEDIDGRDFAACPAAGLFWEDTGDFSPSSPALEASFPGC